MLWLGFLGPMEIWDADRQVHIQIPGAKARRVLAALGARPRRVVGMDALVDAVWPDDPPPTARKQIRNTVSLLRGTAIGSRLVTRGAGYLLDVAADQTDVGEFERCLALAEQFARIGNVAETATVLRKALDLWRGPAFADVGGPEVESLAVGLEERRWSALTRWARASVQLGEHAKVVDELAGVARQQPMREPLAGALMLALYRCGRGGDAIACYHRTRKSDTFSHRRSHQHHDHVWTDSQQHRTSTAGQCG